MTISSMTGFARAQGSAGDYAWAFEIKSVNGRGLDLRFRLPAPFDALEADFRTRAQKALSRGNLQIGMSVTRTASVARGRINEDLFIDYATVAERLAWKANLAAATVGELLRLPGIIETGTTPEEVLDAVVTEAVLASFDAALAGLVSARAAEGAALAAIITGQLDGMAAAVAAAIEADGARPAAIRARLDSQIRALLDSAETFDPARLHQEAMLIASRVDVREEIDRLKAHIEAARGHVAAREPVGRKLDFLAQEFVREANTLCSKANDLALTRIGLDLKALVEQFREQVQNIE